MYLCNHVKITGYKTTISLHHVLLNISLMHKLFIYQEQRHRKRAKNLLVFHLIAQSLLCNIPTYN